MEVRQELAGTGYKIDDLFAQKVGFDGRDAVSLDTRHLVQCPYQLREAFTGRFPEVSNVHPGQYDFLDAGVCQHTSLFHDLRDGLVPAFPPGQRNGAIRTMVIAPVLNLQEGAGPVAIGERRIIVTGILSAASVYLR